MQNSLTYLDGYCERAGQAGLLAEPLNAATNLAFALAAIWIWRRRRAAQLPLGRQDIGIGILLAALVAIAFGSGAWHVFASQETMLADVVPIGLFIHVFLIAFLRQGLRLAWVSVMPLWAMFLGIGIGAEFVLPRDLWNGSVMYLPAILALFALFLAAFRRAPLSVRSLGIALATFLVSIGFRTVDRALCPHWPVGTHFLWHLLNALVLAILLDALLAARLRARTYVLPAKAAVAG